MQARSTNVSPNEGNAATHPTLEWRVWVYQEYWRRIHFLIWPPRILLCVWRISTSCSFKQNLPGERKILILTECSFDFLLRWLQHHLVFIAKLCHVPLGRLWEFVPNFTLFFYLVCGQNCEGKHQIKHRGDEDNQGMERSYSTFLMEMACFTAETKYKI